MYRMVKMSSRDGKFCRLAEHIATWSKDPHVKVGAVLVNPNRVTELFTGYNGFPRGVEDHAYRYLDKTIKHPMIIHAELNAIITAKCDLTGYSIYSTRYPCIRCTMTIIQSGITLIVAPIPDSEQVRKHGSEYQLGLEAMTEAGVTIKLYDPFTLKFRVANNFMQRVKGWLSW